MPVLPELYRAAASGDLAAVEREISVIEQSGDLKALSAYTAGVSLPCDTALGIATQNNRLAIVEALLNAKANPNFAHGHRSRYKKCDYVNDTALDIALASGNRSLVELILHKSLDKALPAVNPISMNYSGSNTNALDRAFIGMDQELYALLAGVVVQRLPDVKDDNFFTTGDTIHTFSNQLLKSYIDGRASFWTQFMLKHLSDRLVTAQVPAEKATMIDYALCKNASVGVIEKMLGDGILLSSRTCDLAAGNYDDNMECNAYSPAQVRTEVLKYLVDSKRCDASYGNGLLPFGLADGTYRSAAPAPFVQVILKGNVLSYQDSAHRAYPSMPVVYRDPKDNRWLAALLDERGYYSLQRFNLSLIGRGTQHCFDIYTDGDMGVTVFSKEVRVCAVPPSF